MNANFAIRYRSAFLAVLVLAQSATFALAQVSSTEKQTKTKGLNCLFMGHSFFAPVAKSFGEHAVRAGFTEHRQIVKFAGGANGTPGRFWKALPEDDVVKTAIKKGTVDLIGLTFHPDAGSKLEDYKSWIDFALEHNPKTMFFIMAPWPRYLGRSIKEYAPIFDKFHNILHGYIDELRKSYPSTTIFCIPQGKGMVRLYEISSAGMLPEIPAVMKPNKQSKEPALFRDRLGHGDKMPIVLGQLIWLESIYQVDVRKYAWDTGHKADLKTLAHEIVKNDPHSQIKTKR